MKLKTNLISCFLGVLLTMGSTGCNDVCECPGFLDLKMFPECPEESHICDGVSLDGGENEETNNCNLDALLKRIGSIDEFEDIQDDQGTAVGHQFSGAYTVTDSGLNFSDDCEADFILTYDFFVDLSKSEEEVEEQIAHGFEETTSTVSMVQEDGVLIIEEAGDDDTDLSGTVNRDGNFCIVSGSFIDRQNYYITTYYGEITEEKISGIFEAEIHVEDHEPVGTCRVQSAFSGTVFE